MISTGLAERLRGFYVGKLCAIVTQPMALPMTAVSFPQWFTVMIDDIDQEAIVGTDVSRKTKHVFFFPIISIAEEQVVTAGHPEYNDIKKEMEETIKKEQDMIRNQSMPTRPEPMHSLEPVAVPSSVQVSIDSIQKQAAELKQKWTASAVEGVHEPRL